MLLSKALCPPCEASVVAISCLRDYSRSGGSSRSCSELVPAKQPGNVAIYLLHLLQKKQEIVAYVDLSRPIAVALVSGSHSRCHP